MECAELAQVNAAMELGAAREARTVADAERAKLAAEVRALTEILAVRDGERWPPMIDSVIAPAGLETALGAALGEELTSALDPEADRHWRELPAFDPVPPLPAGATALAEMLDAPSALCRSLSLIGLVEDERIARECHADMAPGQMLVSREGGIWRWDGYTVRAGTPTAAAVRLRQRNRLAGLRDALAGLEKAAQQASATQAEAEARTKAATIDEQSARNQRRESERLHEVARAKLATLRNQATTVIARLAGIEEQYQRLEQEHQEAVLHLEQARAAHAAAPNVEGLREVVNRARAALSEARSRESAALSARDRLAREHATCTERRRADRTPSAPCGSSARVMPGSGLLN